jgi:hypothetical protein
MKKVIALLTVFLLFSNVLLAQSTSTPTGTAQTPETTGTSAKPIGDFKFKEETWNFGKTPLDKAVTHKFIFTNVGNAPIVIDSCKAFCYCTTFEYSKEPVLPGKSGVIKVAYNADHTGEYSKSVAIFSNAKQSNTWVFVKGNIVEPPAGQTTPGAAKPK